MPPPDPDTGGVQGLLGNLFPGNNAAALYQGLLSDPATQQQMNQRALAAMAGSFAESAMPTRLPTPFGAVLGRAAAATGPAQDAVIAARLQAAQGQEAGAQAAWLQQSLQLMPQLSDLNARAFGGAGGAAAMPPPAAIPGGPVIPGAGPAPYGGGKSAMFTPEQIAAAAQAKGIDPVLANTVVGIESSHGADTSNTKSPSNTGLFQMARADAPGGMNDKPANQLEIGLNQLAKEKADLEARLGRPASNAEVYLAHQQGADGAAALLTNPSKPAGEVTRPINISNNGGNPKVPSSVFTDYWANRYAHFSAPYVAQAPVKVTANGPVTGLLNPPQAPPPTPGMAPPPTPGAAPPLAPETVAYMQSRGVPDQAIARANGAVAAEPQAPPPGPLAQGQPPPTVPGTPPTSLIPSPPQQAVPPITKPQAAPSQAAPYDNIPGAPTPDQIAAAKQAVALATQMRVPIPPGLAEIATWDIKGAEAKRDALIKYFNTAQRPWSATPQPGGGYSQAPGPASVVPGIPGQTPSQLVYPSTTPGAPPQVSPIPGTTPLSPEQVEAQQARGRQQPITPTTAPVTTEPVPTARGTQLPPTSMAAPITGTEDELKARSKDFAETVDKWGNSTSGNYQAEQRINAMAGALRSFQSGPFATQLAEAKYLLNKVGIHVLDGFAGSLADAQIVLKNNIGYAIQSLDQSGLSRQTQGELFAVQQNFANPILTPEANQAILAQALGYLKWERAMQQDWADAKKAGWRDPQDYQRAWTQMPNNNLNKFVDQAQKDVGPLAGQPGGQGAPPAARAPDFIYNPQTKRLEPTKAQ